MIYHSIRGVPLSVCTAEQKIAYNLALCHHTLYIDEYNRLPMQFQKSELIAYAIDKMLERYRMGYNYKPRKYNEDAIYSALHAGFESFLNAPYHILSSYSDIGDMFPAHYLNA